MALLKRLLSPPALRPDQIVERIKELESISLFEGLREKPQGYAFLSEVLNERTFSRGQIIFNEGESGSELYLLISGKVGIYKKTLEGDEYQVAVADHQTQPFFGEGALLDSDNRSATLKAEDNCHCFILDRGHFELFCREHPDLGISILQKIAGTVMLRMRKINGDLMLLYQALVAEIRER